MSWLLWIVLLWAYGCMYLFELWFCPDICSGVGLLNDVIILFLVFLGTSILFSIVPVPTYSSISYIDMTYWKTKPVKKTKQNTNLLGKYNFLNTKIGSLIICFITYYPQIMVTWLSETFENRFIKWEGMSVKIYFEILKAKSRKKRWKK